jgi:AraC family transcriptional regulator
VHCERVVEAELKAPGVDIHVVWTQWPSRFDHTFNDPKHLLALYLSPISSASGQYIDDDKTGESIQIGSLFFRPAARQLHSWGRAVGTRSIQCWFDPSRFDGIAGEPTTWDIHKLNAALNMRSGHFRPFMLRLMKEAGTPGFASTMIADAFAVVLMQDVSNYLSSTHKAAEHYSLQKERLLRIVRERIEDLCEVTPTVRELASLCAISERHLLRVFTECTGQSLIKYVRQRRIEKARTLLRTTGLPLKEIAFKLGFSNHASFSTAFRQEVGVTPGEFRRDHRRLF